MGSPDRPHTELGTADPLGLDPVFETDDGSRGADPFALAGSTPTYSLAVLARYLTWPVLHCDFHPGSPFVGVRRVRPPPPSFGGDSDPTELPDRFAAAVERSMDGTDAVAVSFSGGMDSAAVLLQVARHQTSMECRLVAVTVDLRDDAGRRTGDLAEQVLAALGVPCELIRIRPEPRRWPEPPWSPVGPRFDAEPRYHLAVSRLAREHGAQVLLDGLGADQVFRAPAYLAGDLVRARRFRDARSYLAGRRRRSGRLADELIPLAVPRLVAPSAVQLYAAVSRRYDPGEAVAPVLTEPYLRLASAWLAGEDRIRLRRHLARRETWPAAAAVDQAYPVDYMVAADPELPERSPFLDDAFAAWATRLPLTARYDGRRASDYLREKHLVAGLLPPRVLSAVPETRVLGYQAFDSYWKMVSGDAARLVELSLIRPDWQRVATDAFQVHTVNVINEWVREAERRGAAPEA